MVIDTSRTVRIFGSPWKMWGLFLLGVGMTLLSLALALPLFRVGSGAIFAHVVGWIGGLFFGFCTAMIAWQAITTTGPVVTLSPSGIRDVRLVGREIPWSALQGLSTWSHQGQKIMVLAVDPDVEAALPLSRLARMTRRANRSLGADGLCVSAQGLKGSYDELFDLTAAYAMAHGTQFVPDQ